jgi:L-cysteine desulfidase
MNLLQKIFDNEVFPAIGCTEPISCAYATAAAVEQLKESVEKIEITVDPGTFKNGAAVTVPNSNGMTGNLIASALGAVIAKSSLRLEILKNVTPAILKKAKKLLGKGIIRYQCKESEKSFHIEVTARAKGESVHCIVSEGHTNITCLEKNKKSILHAHPHAGKKIKDYHDILKKMTIEKLLREVTKLDNKQREYIKRGIKMNMAISEKGIAMKRTAYQLQHMHKKGIIANDLFYKVKLRVASAVDARMGGLAEPVMTSGGSGNQGVLTILVPYLVGRDQKIRQSVIEESIAISHAMNSYIKCFVGELSVLCGCAIAASIAAAIALVYQKAGIDMPKIAFAVDNVIGDLCGLICDGAKPGCAMKIVSGADSVIRSSFMALSGYGLSVKDGVLGISAEESIKNLSRISLEGMGLVDPTLVHILQKKMTRSGLA